MKRSTRRQAALLAVAWLACAGSFGCGGTKTPVARVAAPTPKRPTRPVPAQPSAAPAHVDLAQAFHREVPPLPKQRVATDDGLFHAEVEAHGEPQIALEDDVPVLTIPIGTDAPIVCMLHAAREQAAHVVANALAQVPETVQLASARAVDVSLAGEELVLFVEADYLARTDQRAFAGLFKIAVQSGPSGSIVCSHDEAGYKETFRRVVRGLVATSARDPLESPPQRRELAVLKIGDQPVGLSERQIRAKGTTYEVTTHVAVVFPKENRLTPYDLTMAETFDESGALASGRYVELAGDREPQRLEVTRTAPKRYSATGTFGGKPVNTEFKTKAELTDAFGQRKRIAALARKGSGELRIPVYSPPIDVAGSTERVYRAAGNGSLLVESASGARAKAHVDEDGTFDRYEDLSDAPLVEERVLVRGSLER
jgi:hypothetical protein